MPQNPDLIINSGGVTHQVSDLDVGAALLSRQHAAVVAYGRKGDLQALRVAQHLQLDLRPQLL